MTGETPGSNGYPMVMPPPPPVPTKKPGGTVIFIWSIVSCGALLIAMVIFGAIAIANYSKNDNVKNAFGGIMSASSCSENLKSVRIAIRRYRKANQGGYPPSLAVLTPKYMSADVDLGCSSDSSGKLQPMEYFRPDKNSAEDAVVVRVYTGQIKVVPTQTQILHVCLLRDGRIVMDQVARTELEKGASEGM